MAFQDVPEIPFAPFIKSAQVFANIGDKFLGIYRSKSEGKYGTDNVFDTNIGPVTLTLKGGLQKQLDSADLQGGELVAMQLKAKVNVGKESPMKTFKVAVDREWKAAPPKNGLNVVLPVRAPAQEESEDDIPF